MNIDRATKKDIARFYGIRLGLPWEGLVAKEGDLITGAGGVVVDEAGEVWGFLDLSHKSRKPIVFRNVIMYLRELRKRGVGGIKVTCDTAIPRAEEFLKRLGFVRTGEVSNGMEVWSWLD